jgi:hypothetical protein
VTRDRLMASLARRHPHYAWDRNCGYATRRHIDALQSHGSCAHHRRSFVVKALLPGAIVLEIIESADAHHTDPDFPDAHTSL